MFFNYLLCAVVEVTWLPEHLSWAASGAILIARARIIDRLDRMGAKYLPTIKDLKASQRFQEKQKQRIPSKKLATDQLAKKAKKI